jgi:hypothetical protein
MQQIQFQVTSMYKYVVNNAIDNDDSDENDSDHGHGHGHGHQMHGHGHGLLALSNKTHGRNNTQVASDANSRDSLKSQTRHELLQEQEEESSNIRKIKMSHVSSQSAETQHNHHHHHHENDSNNDDNDHHNLADEDTHFHSHAHIEIPDNINSTTNDHASTEPFLKAVNSPASAKHSIDTSRPLKQRGSISIPMAVALAAMDPPCNLNGTFLTSPPASLLFYF